MDWILLIVFLFAAYAVIAYYIHSKKLWEDHITFYGPIMAIKTNRIGFFDKFAAFRTFFRIYGTVGVVAVIIVSVFITVMLFISIRYTLIVQPEPTGIYKPQNILLLPGINEYVPSTIAVWLAFIITIGVHEFGHAILCRVENIKVKTMGALVAVIPIGFFVEPDEEELDRTKGMAKIRMFGAGITNNLVVGFSCFVLLILCMGLVVPVTEPIIHGVYKDYPASNAGIPPGSVITAVNGVSVSNRADVSTILNTTKPGTTLVLTVTKDSIIRDYPLTLAAWPGDIPDRTSGFMGVEYYDGNSVMGVVNGMLSPIGFFQFLVVPFSTNLDVGFLRILAFETPEMTYYHIPFESFWGVVHLLFWCAWINLNVGIFNAIPMIPLDGGYIFKEGVDRLLDRRGLMKYSSYITGTVSYLMLVVLISLIALPYLLHF
ncbi:MAG: site-2 protease family protein [Methanoregula sp.]|jgi:membrane-associated protease RseP (regulator of RpoE activity)|nr:site-2 protease family protein [Methanoregula sp.]